MQAVPNDHRLAEKIQRHRQFLLRENPKPLVGCIIGWEGISRYTRQPESFFPLGEVKPDDIHCARFATMYDDYAATLTAEDDLLRTLEPLPFFPWCEAAAGCPIRYTGNHFWSTRIWPHHSADELERMIEILAGNVRCVPQADPPLGPPLSAAKYWRKTYTDFIVYLSQTFGARHPIGQSILRGPLDIAAALLGEEDLILFLFEEPSLIKELLSLAAKIFLTFIDAQDKNLRPFAGGYGVGSYYLWTPGKNLRLQEDAMALLSPDLYQEYVRPHDEALAAVADWTLFHLHAASLHLLDALLAIDAIKIFQVSLDQGRQWSEILPSLQKIQESGKCLVLKGRMRRHDWALINHTLRPQGLCVQIVVDDEKEAEQWLKTLLPG